MRAEIQICALCQTPMEANHDGIYGRKKIKKMMGLVVDFGGSNNGWGYRQDYFKFSDEVCIDCFNKVEEKMNEVEAVIESLKPRKKNFRLGGLLG